MWGKITVRCLLSFFVLISSAMATPQSILLVNDNGQLKLFLYEQAYFGYVEEVYEIKDAELQNLNFVYESTRETGVICRIRVVELEANTDNNNNPTAANLTYHPMLVSYLGDAAQPITNIARISTALNKALKNAVNRCHLAFNSRRTGNAVIPVQAEAQRDHEIVGEEETKTVAANTGDVELVVLSTIPEEQEEKERATEPVVTPEVKTKHTIESLLGCTIF